MNVVGNTDKVADKGKMGKGCNEVGGEGWGVRKPGNTREEADVADTPGVAGDNSLALGFGPWLLAVLPTEVEIVCDTPEAAGSHSRTEADTGNAHRVSGRAVDHRPPAMGAPRTPAPFRRASTLYPYLGSIKVRRSQKRGSLPYL